MAKVSGRLCANLLGIAVFAMAAQVPSRVYAESSAEKLLLVRAQSLFAHGHSDLAVQIWQQVLLSDPTSREALLGIAKADMQMGKTEQAQKYAQRLRQLGASAADVKEIESVPHEEAQSVRLDRARRLAQEGRYGDAVAAYRDLYPNGPPPGEVAREFYQTEAAIPASRRDAVEGLRRLAGQFSADPQYAIALGQILTYDPKTREEGISLLRRWDRSPEAQQSLKQALSWTAEGSGAPATPAENPLEGSAYRALNSDHLDEAEQQFKALLAKDPKNAKALSGMGYVFLKRGDFTQAEDYLEKGRAAGATRLDGALSTARFWNQMAKASSAEKSGDNKAAVALYRDALQLKPDSPEAADALAGALMQAGDWSEAAATLQHAVTTNAQNENAWRNLFLALSQLGSWKEALAATKRMPGGVEAQLENDPVYLRLLIQGYLASGRKADADRITERALALPFPNHGRDLPVDQQLDYAALLMTIRHYEPALRLYRQILAIDPQNAGAWSSLIAAQHQLDRDDDAIATIRRMPQAAYEKGQSDPGFLALLGSIYQARKQWDNAEKYLEQAVSIEASPQPGIELQLAAIYNAQGKQQKAYAIYRGQVDRNPDNQDAWRGLIGMLHQANRDQEALREMENMPDDVRLSLEQDTSYLQTLAAVQQATGKDRAALQTFALIEQLCSDRQVDEPAEMQIQYGWALLKYGNDRKLYSVIARLAAHSDLTVEQQANFHKMWASWSVRRANAAISAGNLQLGVTILETAAQAFPKDPDIYNALAGAYWKAGQPKKAVVLYGALDMRHATQAQYRGAIGAALAAQDMKAAETWLEAALKLYRNDPAILQMAAQFEQARGDSTRAAAYYRAALDAMGPGSANEIFSHPADSLRDGEDQGQGSSATRELMRLLAPSGPVARNTQLPDGEEGTGRQDLSWRDSRQSKGSTLGDFAPTDTSDRDQTSSSFIPRDAPSQPAEDVTARAFRASAQVGAPSSDPTLSEYGSIEDQPIPPSRPGPILRTALEMPPSRAYVQQPGDDSERRSSSSRRAKQKANEVPAEPVIDTGAAARLQEAADQLATPSTPAVPNRPVALGESPQESEGSGIGGELQLQPASRPAPYQMASSVLPPLTAPMVARQVPSTPRDQIQQQLAIIEGESSGWTGGTASLDYRSGQPGFDQLAMFSAQAESSVMVMPGARATFLLKPVLLDSGQATAMATFRQGTLSAASVPTFQAAAGTGGELQLQTSNFGMRAGVSPRGFLVQNFIGGVYIHPATSHFTLDIARDPIMDTQLSFAGLRDQGNAVTTVGTPLIVVTRNTTGNAWGGVISNSGEFKISRGDELSGWYIQGGGQYLTGLHVPTNERIDGDGGAYWSAWQNSEYGKFVVGMNFFAMHYEHNLRYFTYGQGGYFSPGAYMLAAVPLTFTGTYGPRWHYRATGSLGLQAFQEDSTPYFPLDPAIQSAQGNLTYPQRTSVGANYNFESEGSYSFSDHWFVGAYAAFNNTRDYASDKVGFFVRFLPRPQPLNQESGPTGLFPIQGMRPLQTP